MRPPSLGLSARHIVRAVLKARLAKLLYLFAMLLATIAWIYSLCWFAARAFE